VALALRILYGVDLPGLDYAALSSLSRLVEQTYGLIERATQPITGVVTHTVQAGIRTELVGEARWMFDVIDPVSIGAELNRSFGVRAGLDDMRRILSQHGDRLAAAGLTPTTDLAERVYPLVVERWQDRSREVKQMLGETIRRYHELLARANFTEEEVVEFAMESAGAEPFATQVVR
jgi:homocitrate synthase NifV